jgi:hypothetical protein
MQRLEVSCAVRHIYIYIYIYVVIRLRVKHAVEIWVLLARYFIYVAYLGKGKGPTVNCHTATQHG